MVMARWSTAATRNQQIAPLYGQIASAIRGLPSLSLACRRMLGRLACGRPSLGRLVFEFEGVGLREERRAGGVTEPAESFVIVHQSNG